MEVRLLNSTGLHRARLAQIFPVRLLVSMVYNHSMQRLLFTMSIQRFSITYQLPLCTPDTVYVTLGHV